MSGLSAEEDLGEAVRVRFLQTVETLTECYYQLRRANPPRWFPRIVWGLLIAIFAGLTVALPLIQRYRDGVDAKVHFTNLVVSSVGVVGWFYCCLILPTRSSIGRRVQQTFGGSPLVGREMEWEFSPSHLSLRTMLSENTCDWAIVTKVVETRTGFLLFFDGLHPYWIPTSGFATQFDLDRFTALIRTKVPELRMLDPARFVGKPTADFEEL